MGQWTKARIQLCGRYVANIDGCRIEDALPGRLGRVLFAYLILSRGRPLPRDTLLMAGWGQEAPAEARNALTVLMSKLRRNLGPEHLHGRTEIELLLPTATFVDVEAALEGAHRAESSIAQRQWAKAWGPAGIAYHVATRPFLTGLEAPWIDEWRRRLNQEACTGTSKVSTGRSGTRSASPGWYTRSPIRYPRLMQSGWPLYTAAWRPPEARIVTPATSKMSPGRAPANVIAGMPEPAGA
jgi:DNA-binding SARP family transcriptional activator